MLTITMDVSTKRIVHRLFEPKTFRKMYLLRSNTLYLYETESIFKSS